MTVYFIGGDFGMVKIGYTEDALPAKRLAQLRTGCPLDLRVLAHCPGSLSDEKVIHKALKRYRGAGEWFRLAPRVAGLVGYVAEFGTLDGWAESVRDRLRLAAYIKTFKSPKGFGKLDGLPRHEIAWKLRDAADYQSKEPAYVDWACLVREFHGAVPIVERTMVAHRVVARDMGFSREFTWLARRTGKVYDPHHSGGLRRTAELIARNEEPSDEWMAALWVLACVKDFVGRDRCGEMTRLARCVPELDGIIADAAKVLAIEEPWGRMMTNVLPVAFSIPQNCALSKREFMRHCAGARAANYAAFCVLVEWREGVHEPWPRRRATTGGIWRAA